MEENVKNEIVKSEEMGIVKGFDSLRKESKTKMEIYTNITNDKEIYNLQANDVDVLLNDVVGNEILVKKVLVQKFAKPMDEPEYDENGEIVKDTEVTMSVVLVDDAGQSYATGSKVFGYQIMSYLANFGLNEEGLNIRIIKKSTKNSNNKALGFELV